MITFRGLRTNGRGWVDGDYTNINPLDCGAIDAPHIRQIGTRVWHKVHPESLGIGDTSTKDRNGKVIFASFEYEEGKMSRGGDIIEREVDLFKKSKTELNEIQLIRGVLCNTNRTRISILVDYYEPVIVGNLYESPELLKGER